MGFIKQAAKVGLFGLPAAIIANKKKDKPATTPSIIAGSVQSAPESSLISQKNLY